VEPPKPDRPAAVIAASISDSIADVLGRFPGYPGHAVRLTIPPGSALFLTAAEFRALKETSDRAGIVTTVETDDLLRRQLATMFGLKTHQGGAPPGPRLVMGTPAKPASPAQSAPARAKSGQIVPLPTGAPDRSGQHPSSNAAERTRMGRLQRSSTPGRIAGAATWARPVEVGPKSRGSAPKPTSTPIADDHDGDGRPSGRRKTVLIVVAAVIGLILVILAGLAVAAVTLTTATVDLELRRQSVTGSAPVQIVTSGAAPAEGVASIPGQYVTVDVTVETSAAATGVDKVGVTPATGTIQLANPTDQAVEILAGTTGTGDTGVEFTITTDTTVPAETDSAPGEAEAAVETKTLGTAANLDPGELSGVLESGVFFSNRLAALAGGTDQDGAVISEDDIEAARSAASEALTEAASKKFAQTFQANVLAIPSTFAINENGESFDHEPGDAAESVTRRGVYSVTALTYAADELEEAVNPALGEALSGSIPEGFALDESSIRLGIPEVLAGEDTEGAITAEVPVDARAIAAMSPEQEATLIERLEGADDDEAEAILAAEPAVESFSIDHSPGWLARGMPDDADRIEIHFDD
jgi:hypothetical protein